MNAQIAPEDARADATFVAAVAGWMKTAARDLPWRKLGAGGRRDPYAALVSEFMLQQTQVSRVLEKFGPFLAAFPTMRHLADASEARVLAAWSGLGYYRRARLLHRAAKEIVERFGGVVPSSIDDLRTLPGVGRYTAGAIASVVFNRPAPLADGNVSRVLLRVSARHGRAGDRATDAWVWARAEELVARCDDTHTPALFNEGLMELGATVCMPAPRCEACPVSAMCGAREGGLQDQIPAPKRPAARASLYCAVVIIRDSRGRVLVERRPEGAMFGGMHQAPTLESSTRPTRAGVLHWAGASGLKRAESFEHVTTHRLLKVVVYEAVGAAESGGPFARAAESAWVGEADLDGLALSNLQRRVLERAVRVAER